MSSMNPRTAAPPARPQSLYFAYGSNLQLKQMAKRCSDSQFQGRARLHNFRWQINDRGFANVFPDPNAFVEGLCYLLSLEDEARLDRSEGVPTAYQKKWIEVEFFPATARLLGRKVTEILQFDLLERMAQSAMAGSQGPPNDDREVEPLHNSRDPRPFGAESSTSNTHPSREVTEVTYFIRNGRTKVIEQTSSPRRRGQSVPAGNHQDMEGEISRKVVGGMHGEPAKVLLYLSQNHIQNGLPWDEYVDRMNWGIIDGRDLGISSQYVDKYITPFLLAGNGFDGNGEPRSRGVRERKRRSRNVITKKQRRPGDPDGGLNQRREQPEMESDIMEWDGTAERHDDYGNFS